MGYDLSNASGRYVRFSGTGWDLALIAAEHYGWEAAGIPEPATWNEEADGPWEHEYWINAGQQVTAVDAAALCAALERAVSAADFVETMQRLWGEHNERIVQYNPRWAAHITPATPELAEGFRARLVELAALAREGPFVIE